MKRVISCCSIVLLLCMSVVLDAMAQTVTIKRVAVSERTRTKTDPDTTFLIYSGLRVFGKGMPVYLTADTAGTVGTFTWTFVSKPAGSAAAFDNASAQSVKFTADSAGQYIVSVSIGGASDNDTLLASTYKGQATTGGTCETCHNGTVKPDKFTPWKSTGHAKIFAEGITGELEVNMSGQGMYGKSCIKCHTTGFEAYANNGNFGYMAKAAGWDTTWYQPYTAAGSMFLIPYQDSTAINQLTGSYSQLVPLSNIGCESCHGPGADHVAVPSKTKISVPTQAGVCLQCHDAPTHHMIGSYWAASNHGTLPNSSHATSTSCFPCHSGTAFQKYQDNKATPGWGSADALQPISCISCHDPHGNGNANQLRTMDVDSLHNGYVPPAMVGGKGRICMTCHQALYSVADRVTTTAPYYGFADRFGPHHGPQTDMFFGSNGYQYGKGYLTGLMTHGGLTDGCATCHMDELSHRWTMTDTTGGLHDLTKACQDCHGAGVTSFGDVQAFEDYDGDGVVEGGQAEVQGLLDKLKAVLPIDTTSGEPVTRMYDSLLVKNRPDLVQGLWNYWFVMEDKSLGVHNTKYAVALLRSSLGSITGVEMEPIVLPKTYQLSQNYPNPFNPSTEIRFSLPEQANVNLTVYDLTGRLIATLVNTSMAPGTHRVTWNGVDDAGRQVSSGVYFYLMKAGPFMTARKMLLLR